MRVALINSADSGGGAAGIARRIGEDLLAAGHEVALVVGRKSSDRPWVYEIPVRGTRSGMQTGLQRLVALVTRSAPGDPVIRTRIRRGLQFLERRSVARRWWGHEDFELPGCRRVWDALPFVPEIIHSHNLHGFLRGTHFDLRMLPDLGRTSALVFTLHDHWLLSGHCAHSFDCERWQIGCGSCPRLDTHPAVRRDATARNFAVKAELFQRVRATVVGCCQWVVDRVPQSLLAPAVADTVVIRNGLDLDYFCPSRDRAAVRANHGLTEDTRAACFLSDHGGRNPFRDHGYVERLAEITGQDSNGPARTFFAVGGDRYERQVGSIRFVGTGPLARAEVRNLLQACDVLIHPARADTFPTAIMEAMACGLPVLATAVGGISEQLDDGVEGFLCDLHNVDGAAQKLRVVTRDPLDRSPFSRNARARAERDFDERRMLRSYHDLYARLSESRRNGAVGR